MSAITQTSLTEPSPETTALGLGAGRRFFRGCGHFVMFLMVVGLLLVGYSAFRTGSVHAGVSWVLGRDFDAYPPRPEVIADGVQLAEIRVQNLSASEITIFGAETKCTCVEVMDLPMKVRPDQIALLHIRAKSKIDKAVPLVLITNSASSRYASIAVVVKAPPAGMER